MFFRPLWWMLRMNVINYVNLSINNFTIYTKYHFHKTGLFIWPRKRRIYMFHWKTYNLLHISFCISNFNSLLPLSLFQPRIIQKNVKGIFPWNVWLQSCTLILYRWYIIMVLSVTIYLWFGTDGPCRLIYEGTDICLERSLDRLDMDCPLE